jgi:hypothetical protein
MLAEVAEREKEDARDGGGAGADAGLIARNWNSTRSASGSWGETGWFSRDIVVAIVLGYDKALSGSF